MKNTNDSEPLDELELWGAITSPDGEGAVGHVQLSASAKAEILKHYRSVRDIEAALPEKHKTSECVECISFDRKFSEDGREHYRIATAHNQAIDAIRSSLNLDGGVNESLF